MKKLYRSRNRVLGGVAAGLAEYFDIDATLMRLLFALLGVTVPSSILAYILAWIIIPADPLGRPGYSASTSAAGSEGTFENPHYESAGPEPVPPSYTNPERSRQVLGYVLIAVGAIVLIRRYVPALARLPVQVLGEAWPVLIIVAGILIIYGAIRGR